jgi:hypothetical protein
MGERNNEEHGATAQAQGPARMLTWLKRAFAGASEDLESWSTPELTEAMVLLHQQLHDPGLGAKDRAAIEARLRRITRQIERRKLG